MTTANKEKVQSFLFELEQLTIKYGIAILGCGCCGSPYLIDVDYGDDTYCVDEDYENLTFGTKEYHLKYLDSYEIERLIFSHE